MAAGQQLKFLRNRRSITVREVEQASRRIAGAKKDKRYQISNGWLAQLENGASEPSISKLFSLSVIYHVGLLDLLRLYEVDVDNLERYEAVANPHLTQLLPAGSLGKVRGDLSKLPGATCLASEIASECNLKVTPRAVQRATHYHSGLSRRFRCDHVSAYQARCCAGDRYQSEEAATRLLAQRV